MRIRKLTYGFVEQVFEDGVCKSQSFSAGDQVAYVDEKDNRIRPNEIKDELYFPFDMEQPDEDGDTLVAGSPCPECGVSLFNDEQTGDLICGKCGVTYDPFNME